MRGSVLRHNWSFNNVMTIVWPIAGGVFIVEVYVGGVVVDVGGGGAWMCTHAHTEAHMHASCWERQGKCVRVWCWVMGGRQVQCLCLSTQGFKVSSCVNRLLFGNISDILSLLSVYMRAGTAKREHCQQIDPRCCSLDWYCYRQWSFSALQWRLHREALGGGKYRRNATLGKSARRKALSDEHRVSGSSLPPLCPG